MQNNRWFERTPFLLSFILLATLLAMYPSLNNGWVNWDDPAYVLENELIRELSLENISLYFSTLQLQGLYHPLTLLSLALDYSIGGENALVYHLHNLLLHLLNVLLVFVFIQLISKNKLIAAITALLFGIHPMHVESVAWISERKDMLYSFYFLLSLNSYTIYTRQEKANRSYYIAALAFFILSLFAKAMAVVLPLILIALDYYVCKKQIRKSLLDKIPFLALSLIFGIVAIIAQQEGQAMYALSDLNWSQTIFIGAYGLIMYILKLVVPINLSAYHPYLHSASGGLPWFIYASAIPVLAAIGFLWKKTTNKTEWLFGVMFFLICILPVLQILSVGKAIISERFTYIAYIGLFYSLSTIWNRFYVNKNSSLRLLALTVLFLSSSALIWISHERTQVWHNNIALWTDVIQVYPNDHLAYCNRASSYLKSNQLELALADCNKCIQFKPDLYESFNNRAEVYRKLGDRNAALTDLTTALTINPNYIKALHNRAALYLDLGKNDEALVDLQLLTDLDWENASGHFNHALAQSRLGNLQAALSAINKSIALKPKEGMYFRLRSSIHQQLNMPQEALSDLELAKTKHETVSNTLMDSLRNNIKQSNSTADSIAL